MHPLQPEPTRPALECNTWLNDWSQKTVADLHSSPSLALHASISKEACHAVTHISFGNKKGIRHDARTVDLKACQHMCKGQAPGVIREESLGVPAEWRARDCLHQQAPASPQAALRALGSQQLQSVSRQSSLQPTKVRQHAPDT